MSASSVAALKNSFLGSPKRGFKKENSQETAIFPEKSLNNDTQCQFVRDFINKGPYNILKQKKRILELKEII